MTASQISDGRIAVIITNASQCGSNFTLYESNGNGDTPVISSSVGGNMSATHYIAAACYPSGTLQLKLQTTGCAYRDEDDNCALHPPERILPAPVTATVTVTADPITLNASAQLLYVQSDGAHRVRISATATWPRGNVDEVWHNWPGGSKLLRISGTEFIGDMTFPPASEAYTITLTALACNAGTYYPALNEYMATTQLSYLVLSPFEPTDCKPCGASCSLAPSLCVGKPVHVGSGDVSATIPLFSIDGPAEPLAFDLSYHSAELTYPSLVRDPIARGWTHTYNSSLRPLTTGRRELMYLTPTGDRHYFHRPGPIGPWSAMTPASSSDVVTEVGGFYRITKRDGTTIDFDTSTGHWEKTVDRWGNTISGTYNSSDELTGVTDALGRSVTLAYTNGRLSSITLPNAGVWRLEYSGTTINLFDPLHTGSIPWRTLEHDVTIAYPRLTRIADDSGAILEEHTYDVFGRGRTSSGHNGRDNVSIDYGSGTATVTQNIDGTTKQQVSTYDLRHDGGSYLATRVQGGCSSCGSSGTDDQYTYDHRGRVTSHTDASGHRTEYEHDAFSNLLTVKEAAGTPLQRITSYSYSDPAWPTLRTSTVQLSATGSGTRSTSNSWNAATRVMTTQRNGHLVPNDTPSTITTTTTYDARHRVISVDGPRTDVTDVTTITYFSDSDPDLDVRGRRNTTTAPPNLTTTIENYDIYGNAILIEDANGVKTELVTDARGRVTSSTSHAVPNDSSESSNYTSSRVYDSRDRLIETTSPRGFKTGYVYEDGTNRLLDTILRDSLNRQAERRHLTLDDAGHVTAEEDQVCSTPAATCASWVTKRSIAHVYDAKQRLIETVQPVPANAKTVYTYDDDGRLWKVRDQNHSTPNTIHEYDALGRLKTVTQTLAGATNGSIATGYTYDVHDNLKTVTDPNGNVTTYAFDDFGRMQQQTSPVTGVTTYSYDAAGNLTSTTDANGAVTTRTYDEAGRVRSAISTRSGSTATVTWDYDSTTAGNYGLGRLATMTDPNGSTVYAYDRRGLLRREARSMLSGASQPFVTTYQYDSAANRTAIGYPSGRTVTYTFDYANRPITASTMPGALTLISNATYRPFGPLVSLALGNGTTQTFDYDAAYRPLTNHLTAGATMLAGYAYTHDAAGNITAIADELDASYSRAFEYDDLNRLVVANSGYTASRTDEEGVPSTRWITGLWGPGSFSYDAMGNMKAAKLGAGRPGGREAHLTYVGTTPKIDVVSQMEVRPPDGLLVSRGRRRMAADASIGVSGQMIYDDAGNERSLLATRTYSPRNLLESIEEPSETSERHVVAYGYDGRNVRIARSEWTTGMLAAPRRFYTYTPELNLLSMTNDNAPNVWEPAPVTDGSTRYDIVWFGGRPVAQIAGGATTVPRYTFTDHLGTPLIQTDAAAQVIWRAEYEPYGNIYEMRVGSAGDQPLRFPGQEYAGSFEGTDENYNIFRWYRTAWGRYTQSDPMDDGQRNVYSYASANPLSVTDPLGLFEVQDRIVRSPISAPRRVCGSPYACTQVSAILTCACDCDPSADRVFANATLILFGRLSYYNGPFSSISERPYDRSVVDARTAMAHEFTAHIHPSLLEIAPAINALERRVFDSSSECRTACDETGRLIDQAFRAALRASQNYENSRGLR